MAAMIDDRKRNFTKIFQNDIAKNKTSTNAMSWECTTYIMTSMDVWVALRLNHRIETFFFPSSNICIFIFPFKNYFKSKYACLQKITTCHVYNKDADTIH